MRSILPDATADMVKMLAQMYAENSEIAFSDAEDAATADEASLLGHVAHECQAIALGFADLMVRARALSERLAC